MGLFNNLRTFLTEPIFDGVRSGILSEVNKPKRSPDMRDESVGAFISRRFGSALADNIVSAVFHGIYAGDIYKLSARSIVPVLWHMEEKYGSLMRGFLEASFGGERPVSIADLQMDTENSSSLCKGRQLKKQMGDVSLYAFKDGLGELVNKLSEEIAKAPNVTISTNRKVHRVRKHSQQANVIEVRTCVYLIVTALIRREDNNVANGTESF